jgi:hypothetical protein
MRNQEGLFERGKGAIRKVGMPVETMPFAVTPLPRNRGLDCGTPSLNSLLTSQSNPLTFMLLMTPWENK